MLRVAGMLSDAEPVVRQALLHFFKTILPLLESSTKRSFFDYLSAQLCCAMNHISGMFSEIHIHMFIHIFLTNCNNG